MSGEAAQMKLGEYKVLEEVGEGAMGRVLKAQHQRMDRIVALKVLASHLVDSPKAVQRFHREAKMAAQLAHPNIVTAYDAGEQDGVYYLVTEYVEGKNLSVLVQEHGPTGWRRAVDWIVQAARGLGHAHEHGVIHRDVKPSNLMLATSMPGSSGGTEPTIKILDLGLARTVVPASNALTCEQLTVTGQLLGTCEYLAPEQAENPRKADERADIYALGCTMYYVLTGRPPYGGSTDVSILLAHRHHKVPSLLDVSGEVPNELDRVFQKLLAKRPEDRFQSMQEVIDALELVGMSSGSNRVPFGGLLKRNVFWAVLAVGVGAALTVPLAISLYEKGSGSESAGESGNIDATRERVEQGVGDLAHVDDERIQQQAESESSDGIRVPSQWVIDAEYAEQLRQQVNAMVSRAELLRFIEVAEKAEAEYGPSPHQEILGDAYARVLNWEEAARRFSVLIEQEPEQLGRYPRYLYIANHLGHLAEYKDVRSNLLKRLKARLESGRTVSAIDYMVGPCLVLPLDDGQDAVVEELVALIPVDAPVWKIAVTALAAYRLNKFDSWWASSRIDRGQSNFVMLFAMNTYRKQLDRTSRQRLEFVVQTMEVRMHKAAQDGVLGVFWWGYLKDMAYIREGRKMLDDLPDER